MSAVNARVRDLAHAAYAELEPEERHGMWRPHERWNAVSRASLSTNGPKAQLSPQETHLLTGDPESNPEGDELSEGPAPWSCGFGPGAELPQELRGTGELALQALGEALSQNLQPDALGALADTLARQCAISLEVAPADDEDLFDDWLGLTRFSGGERRAPCGVWISAAHGAQLPEAHPWSALIALCLRAQDITDARHCRSERPTAAPPTAGWTTESDWDRQPVFVHWTHPDFGLLSAACRSRLTSHTYAQARRDVTGRGIRPAWPEQILPTVDALLSALEALRHSAGHTQDPGA